MQITIIGLGLVGTSFALALKAADPQTVIIGHDPDSDNLKRAKELKAIDKTHWNLISACDKSQVVMLDLPPSETGKTIKALGPNMERGVLVMDTSAVKRPVMALAEKHMGEGVAFIGAHLVSHKLLPSMTEPSADLTHDATLFLVAPDKVSSETVNLATTLAEAVGAQPRFIDADEHDGLMAATHGLPLAGALATFSAVAEPAGLKDRAAGMGAELYNLGSILGETPEETAELASANADLVLPWIDIYIDRLTELREALADKNQEELERIANRVHDTLLVFLRRGEEPKNSIGDSSIGIRQMLLGGLGHRKSN